MEITSKVNTVLDQLIDALTEETRVRKTTSGITIHEKLIGILWMPHRTDGPAKVYPDLAYMEWWLNGKYQRNSDGN